MYDRYLEFAQLIKGGTVEPHWMADGNSFMNMVFHDGWLVVQNGQAVVPPRIPAEWPTFTP